MKLSFSQTSQPTASAQLGQGFKAMSLSSQSAGGSVAGTQDRPPVPMFAEGPPVSSQQLPLPLPPPLEIPPLSQQELLGTQDFITPVDQFNLDYDPKDAKRSPARLSPNRVKRPRQAGGSAELGTEEGGEVSQPRGSTAGPSGHGPAAVYGSAAPRRPLSRVHSPPCYRNIFTDGDGEDEYAAWRAPRLQQAQQAVLSRYRQDFKEIGLLGQGNFSKVFRARHRMDGREYAVKRTLQAVTPGETAFAHFIQEAQVLAHLPPHPHIVQYFFCWSEATDGGEHLYMMLEKCDVSLGIHASLGRHLREGELLEVAEALAHLHRHGVAHLDVKPDNIFLRDPPEADPAAVPGGPSCPPVCYKLGDFGQATRLNSSTPVSVEEGDSRYLPLELLRGDLGRLDKADMFALGASLLELATRKELPSSRQSYADLRAGKLPLLTNCSQRFAAVVRLLMSPNPDDRPTAEKVLAMPLLSRKPPSPGTSQQEQQQQQQQQLAHHASMTSAQSTAAALDDGIAASAASGAKQFGGLVLQRSKAK